MLSKTTNPSTKRAKQENDALFDGRTDLPFSDACGGNSATERATFLRKTDQPISNDDDFIISLHLAT